MGKYLYGIMMSGEKKSFGPIGVTGGEEVYSVPFRDIAAVVSDSKIVNCSNIPKDSMTKILLAHQKAVEQIMNLSYTIIPVRLGTFVNEEEEVGNILAKGYGLIQKLKEKINGKIEIDLAAVWSDFPHVLKETSEETKIMEFRKNLLGKPGGATMEDRIRAGEMIKEALDQKKEDLSEEIVSAVKQVSADFRVHECMDDKMVVNTAFLIEKSRHGDFDEIIQNLNAKFDERLNFRCIGPLPPYSFYTLEVKKMDFEEIDWARRKLGINEFISEDEIKKAYQRAACTCHPDKNPDKPDTEKEFNDVTKAYRIISDYCLASQQTDEKGKRCFGEQEVKNNLLLIKVRA